MKMLVEWKTLEDQNISLTVDLLEQDLDGR
jgi:hypothetical protein